MNLQFEEGKNTLTPETGTSCGRWREQKDMGRGEKEKKKRTKGAPTRRRRALKAFLQGKHRRTCCSEAESQLFLLERKFYT